MPGFEFALNQLSSLNLAFPLYVIFRQTEISQSDTKILRLKIAVISAFACGKF